jgi:hypothetical protein
VLEISIIQALFFLFNYCRFYPLLSNSSREERILQANIRGEHCILHF